MAVMGWTPLAMRHTDMAFLGKQVAVWFRAGQGTAGVPCRHNSICSPGQDRQTFSE